MKDPSRWVYKKKRAKGKRYDKKAHEAQRVKHGFSTYDWWGFNSYLTFVILGGLKKFKAESMGYPGTIITMGEWVEILDIMIEGFEAHEEFSALETYEPSKITYEEWSKPLIEKWNTGSKLFIKYYGDLWD